ncbi:MAG: imidazole glycerol phosphate synthase subunit HisH [Planctomycetes bacterium]|nr:imidazole glycerol phosphate synthase subunit HisH [Planctomycetota bacterium]
MIAIIDYGTGNLRSVQKAFEKIGATALIATDPTSLRRAEKIVLPGVSAFKDAMDGLVQLGLVETIKEQIADGKPFLGICIGLQLLFTKSYEDGEHDGLDVIPGEVVRFSSAGIKVPHMGWNGLQQKTGAPLLAGIPDGAHMYFAHSYHGVPADSGVLATETEHGVRFASSVWTGNVFATQFHPEKSQRYGLRLLRNFVEA